MMDGVLVDNMSAEILLAPAVFFGLPIIIYVIMILISKD